MGLHSAWAELGPGPGLPGCRDRMASGRLVLPASSGYQSQSAACASAGSAQRSPSWWCGGHPRAGQQTAAAPHTGEKERQKAGRFRPETRRRWFPRAQKALHIPLGGPSLPTLFSIKAIPIFLGLCSHSMSTAPPHSWTFLLGSHLSSLSLDTRYLILNL